MHSPAIVLSNSSELTSATNGDIAFVPADSQVSGGMVYLATAEQKPMENVAILSAARFYPMDGIAITSGATESPVAAATGDLSSVDVSVRWASRGCCGRRALGDG